MYYNTLYYYYTTLYYATLALPLKQARELRGMGAPQPSLDEASRSSQRGV